MTQEDKELIILWFKRVRQLATDRKNLTHHKMSKQEALNVIRALANDAIYYIEHRDYRIASEEEERAIKDAEREMQNLRVQEFLSIWRFVRGL